MKQFSLTILLFSIVISCGSKQKNHTALPPTQLNISPSQPSYQLMKESGEEDLLIWYINFDWYGEITPDQGIASRKIFTDTGTKIHLIKGNNDRLNQMIAADQMPDLVTVAKNSIFDHSAHRWAYPINKLADTYDPYFYRVAKKDTLAWYTTEQGDIYGYPSFSNDYNDFLASDSVMVGNQAFLVRKDIYDALGEPNMQRPEDFLQVLRDVRNLDLDTPVIPLAIEGLGNAGALVDWLMNFLAIPPIKDNLYYERLYDEEYLHWLDTLRQAYQEDLISSDNFTFDFDEGVSNGLYFALFANGLTGLETKLIINNNRNFTQRYIAIDGPANQNLDPPQFTQSGIGGWALTFIPKQSPKKERAIQLMTYLLSKEGHLATNLGVEGETYYLDDNGIYQYTPEIVHLRATNSDQFGKEMLFGQFWMLKDYNFKFRYTNAEAPEMKQIWQWTRGKIVPHFALEDTEMDPKSPEERIMLQYNQERNDAIVRMLRSSSYAQMMQELDNFTQTATKLDIDRALAIKNEKIARSFEKLKNMGY